MIFVRGIMGDVKLNPAIKIWGGLALFVVLAIAGLVIRFVNVIDSAEECKALGGAWVAGPVPSRAGGTLSSANSCVMETSKNQGDR